MAEDGSPSADDGNASAWHSVLDQLEADLGAAVHGAEAATRGVGLDPAAVWRAPTMPGPLPAELADRARALLAGQRELTNELEQTRRLVAKRLSAVRSVPSARDHSASVYLDVSG